MIEPEGPQRPGLDAKMGPMPDSVLIVEDDPVVRMLLGMLLHDEGVTVTEAASGPDAVELCGRSSFDLVLLDLRLPGMNGFEVCRRIRRSSDVPVIMVTAQDDSHDVVAGLECGADDYITKPFVDRELIARVRAQLRRRPAPTGTSPTILLRDIELRPSEGVVLKANEPIALTRTEFRLLVQLAETPNRVWTRDQLLEQVWGYTYIGDGRLVDSHIHRLRAKVDPDGAAPGLIQTVRGFGYKLVP